MAIRVLGYRTVVEAKGTWPTNYIAKATELKVLNDVEYGKYTDGATRGNVALLMWNMLRTELWDVTSENENNGLSYGKVEGNTMINKYFEDYTYAKVDFASVGKNTDNQIVVTLNDEESTVKLKETTNTYKYFENDFYTFVNGTEVEVLVNEETKTLLMMVPTGEDQLVEGTKMQIEEDYEALSGDTYDYAYGIVEKKDITASTKLTVESKYIYMLEEINEEAVKFNDDPSFEFVYEESEEEDLIIVNGDRGTIKDVEVGDVLSEVTLGEITFYIVTTPETAEGSLAEVVLKDYAKTGTYNLATVGEKSYVLEDNVLYFEDPKSDKDPETALRAAMKNEDVVVIFDFTGRVVAVEFDGKIGDATEDYSIGFFAMTSNVEMKDRRYVVELKNESGKDTYVFAREFTAAKTYYNDVENDYIGTYVAAKINEDNEIVEFTLIANADSGDTVTDAKFAYDDNETETTSDDKNYALTVLSNVTFDKEELEVSGDEAKFDVDSDLVVVTLIKDDKGTPKTTDDVYMVTFSEGTEAIENLRKEEKVLVIKDEAKNFAKAKYVVLFDEVSNKENNLFAIIDSVYENEIDGGNMIAIKETNNKNAKVTNYILKGSVDSSAKAILYSLEENKDGKMELTVIRNISATELTRDYTSHGYIEKDRENPNVSSDGRKALLKYEDLAKEIEINLDSKVQTEDYKDAVVYVLTTKLVDVEDKTQYEVASYEQESLDTLTLKELDRLSFFDAEADGEVDVVLVFRGMAEIVE